MGEETWRIKGLRASKVFREDLRKEIPRDAEDFIGNLQDIPEWSDLLFDRLVRMEGSALKGQHTGRFLERLIQDDLEKNSFARLKGKLRYQAWDGKQEYWINKNADFLVPTALNPLFVIEAKTYASSGGSKQSDVLGDIEKLLEYPKFERKTILAAAGKLWADRANDVAKLFRLKQKGRLHAVIGMDQIKTVVRAVHQILASRDSPSTLSKFIDPPLP